MKKLLVVAAMAAGVTTPVLADSNLSMYGALDLGLQKNTGSTLAIERGSNNRLGFKGMESLGGGLKALFRLEMRFELDTGTTESLGRRPLFQGSSWVGLSGNWGTLRLGRDMTAMQDPIGDFDPFNFQTVGSLDATVGNYSTDPTYAGSSGNRLANALFYSTPMLGHFQINATIGTKERLNGGSSAVSSGYSLSATYNDGRLQAMVGAERSVIEDKFWNASVAYTIDQIRLISSWSKMTRNTGLAETNWLIAADKTFGPGSLKVGYGQIKPENAGANRQVSLGYWHYLSKRTMLYTDVSNRKPSVGEAVRSFDLGLRHTY